jgi:ribose transport system permease protein
MAWPKLRTSSYSVPRLEWRFTAIWFTLAAMLALNAIFMPQSVAPSTLLAVLPFAAFLAIATTGQGIVIMARGIDLSVPAIVSLSCAILLGVSGAQDDRLWPAIAAALLAAAAVGAINGFMIAVLRLNALIVTLAVGSIVMGIAISYRESAAAESTVPPALAEFSSSRILGLPTSAILALAVVLIATFVLRKTVLGRRFELVGSSPEAALRVGVRTRHYQALVYVVAALLYGVMSVLLAGFIRNPTLDVGNPYLLAPIAAAVLGGTAISGGAGSVISMAGAALFLIQLEQSLKMLGFPTAWQMVMQGLAIGIGMYLSEKGANRR